MAGTWPRKAALADARVEPRDVTALIVGNMMAGMLAQQQQLMVQNIGGTGATVVTHIPAREA